MNTFNIHDLADLKTLTVDTTQPKQERLKQFITEVKNPYTVRVGETLVRIEFIGGRSFSDALTAFFSL